MKTDKTNRLVRDFLHGDMPEEIQRRGFLKAGRLWCAGYWEAGGDLCEMQVKRVLGERRYQIGRAHV